MVQPASHSRTLDEFWNSLSSSYPSESATCYAPHSTLVESKAPAGQPVESAPSVDMFRSLPDTSLNPAESSKPRSHAREASAPSVLSFVTSQASFVTPPVVRRQHAREIFAQYGIQRPTG